MSPGEQWLVDRTADEFLRKGEWPTLERLRRIAARETIDLPEALYGMPSQDFIWRPDNQGTVVLSVPGFWRSSTGKAFAEQFFKVVLLCREIYLQEDEEEPEEDIQPKITSEDLRRRLSFDDATIARIHIELRFEYFLTTGGGATSDTEWYYVINHTIAKFKGVTTLNEYFEVRSEIVAPRFPMAPWSPVESEAFEGSLSSPEQVETEDAPIDPRTVFVVHGRDNKARDAMWLFLESLGLHPLDWDEMVRRTGKGTPHTLNVIEAGFRMAKVFVVLMTPDDEARLHVDLQESHDPEDERNLTCQPRPNVMFEAGRAFGAQPDRTILVHIGKLRRVSDLDGLNVVRIGKTKAPLFALANRLEVAGCPIDRQALEVFDPSHFVSLPSHARVAGTAEDIDSTGPRFGRRLGSTKPAVPTPRLSVKTWAQGRGTHLLEIANRGTVALANIEWHLPDDAQNWVIMQHVLPAYPIPSLKPGKHVRLPIAISMGGPMMTTISITALTENGEPFSMDEQLSIYG